MSEHLSPERRTEIRDAINEEYDMTRMKMELFLRAHGVTFLAETAPDEAESPDFMDQLRQTISEQHDKLQRDLTEDEMMLVIEYHQRRTRRETARIEQEARHSLAVVHMAFGVIGYWSCVRGGHVAEAAQRQRTLYGYIESHNLPEVWRYMLDAEFGRY